MANKTKKPAKKAAVPAETSKVTRISAKDTAEKADVKATAQAAEPKTKKVKKDRKNPFVAFATYFKGAWYELTQVRWPNRRATWGLTGAVLIFTAFFVTLIVLLDLLFKFLFEQLLG